jgi:hypothetical protein
MKKTLSPSLPTTSSIRLHLHRDFSPLEKGYFHIHKLYISVAIQILRRFRPTILLYRNNNNYGYSSDLRWAAALRTGSSLL